MGAKILARHGPPQEPMIEGAHIEHLALASVWADLDAV